MNIIQRGHKKKNQPTHTETASGLSSSFNRNTIQYSVILVQEW